MENISKKFIVSASISGIIALLLLAYYFTHEPTLISAILGAIFSVMPILFLGWGFLDTFSVSTLLQRSVNEGVNPEVLEPNAIYYLNGYQAVIFRWKSHYSTYIFEHSPKPSGKTEPINLTFEEVVQYISATKEV